MSKLTYIRCGDYDIPNLKLSVQPETSIGKYGRMRKSYLKEHRPILYNHLLMSEKLYFYKLGFAVLIIYLSSRSIHSFECSNASSQCPFPFKQIIVEFL